MCHLRTCPSQLVSEARLTIDQSKATLFSHEQRLHFLVHIGPCAPITVGCTASRTLSKRVRDPDVSSDAGLCGAGLHRLSLSPRMEISLMPRSCNVLRTLALRRHLRGDSRGAGKPPNELLILAQIPADSALFPHWPSDLPQGLHGFPVAKLTEGSVWRLCLYGLHSRQSAPELWEISSVSPRDA